MNLLPKNWKHFWKFVNKKGKTKSDATDNNFNTVVVDCIYD